MLGHEITHVTAKHTVRAIEKNKVISMGAQEVGGSSGLTQSVLSKLASAAYKSIISNAFDRDDEVEADKSVLGSRTRPATRRSGLSEVLTTPRGA